MNYFRLIVCIVLTEGVGVFAGILTAQSVRTWYPTLVKPCFNPPNWIFAPAWTLLYLLMGVALYIVWQRSSTAEGVRAATVLFFVQLVLNAAWSLIFFGLQSPFWAFVEIVLLWGSILATIALFWRISHVASLLLVPYVLWVTFATVLTFAIWRLNPSS
jgi:benzodiazapine receptor